MPAKTLEQLDNEIAELRNQQIADLLRQREQLLRKNGAVGHAVPATTENRVKQPEKPNITPSAEKLIKFFNVNGRCPRSVVYERSDIPKGTLANLLTNRELFDQDVHKNWGYKGQ